MGARLMKVWSPSTFVFYAVRWLSIDIDRADSRREHGGSSGGYFIGQACKWHQWAEVTLAGTQSHDHTELQGRLGTAVQMCA